MRLPEPRQNHGDKLVTVCAVAFLLIAAIIAAGDIWIFPAFVNNAIPTSAKWLHPAIEAFLVLVVGALATHFVSRLVLEQKRSRQELALRASILDAANDAIFAYRPDGTIVYTNETGYNSLDYTREELMKMNRRDLAASEHGTSFDEWTKRVTEEGELLTELEQVRKDGSPIPVEVRARHIRIGDQELIISVCRDLTQRRQSEAALRSERENFRTSLEMSPLGVHIVAPGGQTLFVNPALLKMLGFDSLEEWNRVPLERRFVPESAAWVASIRERHARGDLVPPYERDVIAIRKDGQRRVLNLHRSQTTWNGLKVAIVMYQDITARKQAEALYHTLTDSSPMGVYIVQDKKFVFSNPVFKTVTGYTDQDLATRDSLALVHPEDRIRTRDEAITMLKGGTAQPYEFRYVTKSGETRWAVERVSSILHQGKRATLGAFLDVTSTKQAEHEIARQRTYFQQLFDSSPDAIALLDTSDQVVEVNSRFESLFGYRGKDIKGQSINELIIPTDRLDEASALSQTVLKGETIRTETVRRRRDGTLVDVSAVGYPIKVAGRLAGVYVLYGDITERKRAEKALLESEQKYRDLVENAPVGIVVTSIDGRVLEVNKTLPQMHGYESKEEFAKSAVADRFNDLKDRERWVALVQETGKVEAFEVQTKRKDGSLFWTSVTSIPRTTATGEQQLISVSQDITERKQAEKKLAYLASFPELNPMIVVELDTLGNLCYYNPAATKAFPDLIEQGGRHPYLTDIVAAAKAFAPPASQSHSIERNIGGRWYEQVICRPGDDGRVRVYGRDISGRKRTQEALRLEKDNFRNSMEMSPIGVQIVTPTGDLVYANKTMLDTWGYNDLAELKAVPMELRFTPDSVAVIRENVKRHKGGNLTLAYEVTAIRKSGELRSLLAHPKEVAWDGEMRVQTLYQDITERKRAEDALVFKTALLEAQIETTTDGILVVDANNKIVLYNNRFREMFQVPQEWLEAGDNAPVLRHVASRVMDPEGALERARYLDGHKEEKTWDVREQGDGRIVENHSVPLVDASGIYRGRVGYFRDITEPRKMRERLEHAAEEWRTTFDSITDFISIHDKNNRLLRVNKAFAGNLGTTPNEVIGKTCHELMHGTHSSPDNCPARRTLETGKPASSEVFEADRGIWLQESTYPLFGDQGEVASTVHIVKDVTEPKQMAQQLMMTDRLASIGELVSGVAHELNNPLTGVIGFSQLLMERDVPDDIKEDLSLVASEAQRAARIVKDLLTFARKHTPVKEPSQINNIIEDVLRLRAYEHNVNNIEVVRHVSPDVPEITADYFQIQQVFLNIIANAEFFMIESHHRGTLTVTTERVDGLVRASFADDGPGISQENLNRIFNPFFTTKEVGKGTGLGMSICHGIVTEHGGRIYARSELGKGATFVVELPIDESPSHGGTP